MTIGRCYVLMLLLLLLAIVAVVLAVVEALAVNYGRCSCVAVVAAVIDYVCCLCVFEGGCLSCL